MDDAETAYDFIAKEYRSIRREWWRCGAIILALVGRWLGLCVTLICLVPLILIAPPVLAVFKEYRERLTDDVEEIGVRLERLDRRNKALQRLVYRVSAKEHALRLLAAEVRRRDERHT